MIEVPLNANQIFAGTDKCVNIRLINVKYDIKILNDMFMVTLNMNHGT